MNRQTRGAALNLTDVPIYTLSVNDKGVVSDGTVDLTAKKNTGDRLIWVEDSKGNVIYAVDVDKSSGALPNTLNADVVSLYIYIDNEVDILEVEAIQAAAKALADAQALTPADAAAVLDAAKALLELDEDALDNREATGWLGLNATEVTALHTAFTTAQNIVDTAAATDEATAKADAETKAAAVVTAASGTISSESDLQNAESALNAAAEVEDKLDSTTNPTLAAYLTAKATLESAIETYKEGEAQSYATALCVAAVGSTGTQTVTGLSYVDSESAANQTDIANKLQAAAEAAVNAKLTADGKTDTATVTVTKVSYTPVENDSANYTFKVTVTYGGKSHTSNDKTVAVADLYTKAEVEAAAKNLVEDVDFGTYADINAVATKAANVVKNHIAGVTNASATATVANAGTSFDVTVTFTYNNDECTVTATLAGALQ